MYLCRMRQNEEFPCVCGGGGGHKMATQAILPLTKMRIHAQNWQIWAKPQIRM